MTVLLVLVMVPVMSHVRRSVDVPEIAMVAPEVEAVALLLTVKLVLETVATVVPAGKDGWSTAAPTKTFAMSPVDTLETVLLPLLIVPTIGVVATVIFEIRLAAPPTATLSSS